MPTIVGTKGTVGVAALMIVYAVDELVGTVGVAALMIVYAVDELVLKDSVVVKLVEVLVTAGIP